MTIGLVLRFLLGLVFLGIGADILVRGAARIARLLGISSLVVGLTVVAFGTSSAELAVSVLAAVRGSGDVAFGNVVGSNICNVFLVLGVSALIAPLTVHAKLVRVDGPIMLLASILLVALAWDGTISRIDGAVLFVGLVVYVVYCVRQARRDPEAAPEDDTDKSGPIRSLTFVVAGLGLLVQGSEWLVEGATVGARALGISDLIIGLTVVSVGTSLPEIAASVMAAVRGQRDMAVGNVVGSNIFNVGCVLGVSGLVTDIPASAEAMNFDVWVMLGASLVCLPMLFTGYRVDRTEAVILVGYYLAYLGFLLLDAQRHDALPQYSGLMLLFVLPLTVGMVAFQVYRAVVASRATP